MLHVEILLDLICSLSVAATSMISCKEFSTPENPALLKNPPTSAYKDVVNLLSYPSDIAIPSPAVQLWSLVPGTCNSQPPGSCEVQEERAVMILGARAMGTDT